MRNGVGATDVIRKRGGDDVDCKAEALGLDILAQPQCDRTAKYRCASAASGQIITGRPTCPEDSCVEGWHELFTLSLPC